MSLQMLSTITCDCGINHTRVFDGEEIDFSSFNEFDYTFTARGYRVDINDPSWPVHAKEPYYIHLLMNGPADYFAQSFGYADVETYKAGWGKAMDLISAFKSFSMSDEEIKEKLEEIMGGNPE